MHLRALPVFCALVGVGAVGVPVGAQVDPAPVVLENGARVILIPVPGATRVGVEVVHRMGSLEEPAGMPQLAHLVEHLTCYGATRGLKEGEAFATGMARGSTNAETLADITRYEHEAPAEDLERILTLEADRLRAVVFTPGLLAQESPRIDQEARFVDAAPTAPLLKYAFIAGPQAWFHLKFEAPLSGATKDFDLDAAARWRARWCRPERTTIAIVGGFERDKALELVRATIGAVPKSAEPAPPPSIDYSRAPRHASVKWTSAHRAVLVAFEPASDPVERFALTVLGDATLENLARDERVQKVATVAVCSNRLWAVGDLPLFVYATVRDGVDPAEAERVVTERFTTLFRSNASSGVLGVAVASLVPPPVPTWEEARAQGRQVFGNRPGFTGDPAGSVLLYHALQAAARDRVNSPPAALGAARAMSPEQARALAERVMAEDKKFVTVFGP
jgi:predicted Zn-dependent peptidase